MTRSTEWTVWATNGCTKFSRNGSRFVTFEDLTHIPVTNRFCINYGDWWAKIDCFVKGQLYDFFRFEDKNFKIELSWTYLLFVEVSVGTWYKIRRKLVESSKTLLGGPCIHWALLGYFDSLKRQCKICAWFLAETSNAVWAIVSAILLHDATLSWSAKLFRHKSFLLYCS